MPRVDGRGGALTSHRPRRVDHGRNKSLRVIQSNESAACGRRAASFGLLASVFVHDGAPCVVARRRFQREPLSVA
ncbi:hypothetical protein DF147_24235 [Burkholderia cenocepacia]|nr:hypothetical protein DF147_24235 [Burkholderia cenocepacia]RQV87450.1 hypothetical protein DF019_23180 [Burkholderia cenocepacia]